MSCKPIVSHLQQHAASGSAAIHQHSQGTRPVFLLRGKCHPHPPSQYCDKLLNGWSHTYIIGIPGIIWRLAKNCTRQAGGAATLPNCKQIESYNACRSIKPLALNWQPCSREGWWEITRLQGKYNCSAEAMRTETKTSDDCGSCVMHLCCVSEYG
jgi:hypothetical protein